MAITIVNQAQTGTGATGTVAAPGATAGNLLICFLAQSASTSAPGGNDNVSLTTGWSTNSTNTLFTAGLAGSIWVMTKTSVGGETNFTPVAGTGGTKMGIDYFELNGASGLFDTIVGTSTVSGSVTTVTSGSVTTSNAGSIILACAGQNGNATSVAAWTGTGPMTNISLGGVTRAIGGSYLPGSTISGATFTANWSGANQAGVLVAAFAPAITANTQGVLVGF